MLQRWSAVPARVRVRITVWVRARVRSRCWVSVI